MKKNEVKMNKLETEKERLNNRWSEPKFRNKIIEYIVGNSPYIWETIASEYDDMIDDAKSVKELKELEKEINKVGGE